MFGHCLLVGTGISMVSTGCYAVITDDKYDSRDRKNEYLTIILISKIKMVSNGPFTADEQKNMCICGCLEEIGATCPSYKLACGHISHIECFPSYINSKLQETKVPCPSPGC